MSDTKTPVGAILQRDKKTYAIVPRTPVGMVSPEVLEAIARVVRKYRVPIVKITSGQRLALVGMEAPDVGRIWEELKMDVGRAVELCLHYVQACPGNSVCRFGVQDSLGLGMELEERYMNVELPAKLKIGVSGCPMSCGESWLRDIGCIGRAKGWQVTFGGNAGGRPRIADEIARDLSREEAVALVGRLIEFYAQEGKRKERTARLVDRVGPEAVKRAVLAAL